MHPNIPRQLPKHICLAIASIFLFSVSVLPGCTREVQDTTTVNQGNQQEEPDTVYQPDTNIMPKTVPIDEVFDVTFPDEYLEALIRDSSTIPDKDELTPGTITTRDLAAITYLDKKTKHEITDLTGLEYCINLQQLFMNHCEVSDISPIRNLVRLWRLSLEDTAVTDFSPIAGLVNLRSLYIGNNTITNISFLKDLHSLTSLWASRNNITDISVLSGLTNLDDLELRENNISDISALSGLTNLCSIDLSYNNISDISPLVENPGITSSEDQIFLSGNPLNKDAYKKYIPELERRGVMVIYDKP